MPSSGSGSASGVASTGGFSLDITTPVGKVRMLATDVDSSNFTFTDAEIQAFIDLQPANLYCAAALVVETWARSQGRLSGSRRDGDGTSIVRRSMFELLALAKSLREAALNGGLVTGTIDVSSPNDLLDSFLPEWRDIHDLPVVE